MAITTLNDVFDVLRAYCRDNLPGAHPVGLTVKLDTGESFKHPIKQPIPATPAFPAAPASRSSLASHSPDFRSASYHGVNYTFTVKQAAVVRALWEGMEDGAPEIGCSTLLQIAGSDAERLRDVFHDHPAFGVMIVPGARRGTYQLAEG